MADMVFGQMVLFFGGLLVFCAWQVYSTGKHIKERHKREAAEQADRDATPTVPAE